MRGSSPRMTAQGSHPLHKTIHHPLFAGLVEADGELVAVDGGDVAVAEFQVEDAVADAEGGRGAGGFPDECAFDGEGCVLLVRAPGAAPGTTPLPVPPPQG